VDVEEERRRRGGEEEERRRKNKGAPLPLLCHTTN
jgi:hypothetical protein